MSTPREVVARAGIDVDVLIDKLTLAARAELAVAYRYTILSVQAFGLADAGLREILQDVRDEDRRHFDALLTRIFELGGRLPEDLQELTADLPSHDELDLLTSLITIEQQATETYADLCILTAGRDPRTDAMVEAIGNEEIEHEAWFREFSGAAPPGRFHRGFRGGSPFLSRLAHYL